MVAGEVTGGEALRQPKHKTAQHGPRNGAYASENRRGEGFHPGQKPDGEAHLPGAGGNKRAAQRGKGGADDEGQGNDAISVNAQQHGHLAVLGRGAHGLAHFGVADEQGQCHHDQQTGHQHDEIPGSHEIAHILQKTEAPGNEAGKGHGVGCLSQLHIVLQEGGHADGGNQRGQPGCPAQGLVGHLFHGIAVG